MSIQRNIISVVRCPALAGVAVEISACTGIEGELKPCPYMLSSAEGLVKCTHNPEDPKKVFAPSGERRESSMITHPEYKVGVQNIFSLQVHQGAALGPEWAAASVNIL